MSAIATRTWGCLWLSPHRYPRRRALPAVRCLHAALRPTAVALRHHDEEKCSGDGASTLDQDPGRPSFLKPKQQPPRPPAWPDRLPEVESLEQVNQAWIERVKEKAKDGSQPAWLERIKARSLVRPPAPPNETTAASEEPEGKSNAPPPLDPEEYRLIEVPPPREGEERPSARWLDRIRQRSPSRPPVPKNWATFEREHGRSLGRSRKTKARGRRLLRRLRRVGRIEKATQKSLDEGTPVVKLGAKVLMPIPKAASTWLDVLFWSDAPPRPRLKLRGQVAAGPFWSPPLPVARPEVLAGRLTAKQREELLRTLPQTPYQLWKRFKEAGHDPASVRPKLLWHHFLSRYHRERKTTKRMSRFMKRRHDRWDMMDHYKLRRWAVRYMCATPLPELERKLHYDEGRKLANKHVRKLASQIKQGDEVRVDNQARSWTYVDALRLLSKLRRTQSPSLGSSLSFPLSQERVYASHEEMREWLRRADMAVPAMADTQCIHIGGALGKTTTAATCAHLLRSAPGIRPDKVGTFTSPHVMSPRECIRIGGEPLCRRVFAENFFYLWRRFLDAGGLREMDKADTVFRGEPESVKRYQYSLDYAVERMPTYDQFLAILALRAFTVRRMTHVVFECATGGGDDLTNFLLPTSSIGATVITGIDPPDYGRGQSRSPRDVAVHVSGLIRPNVPVLAMVPTTAQYSRAWSVLAHKAKSVGTEIINLAAEEQQLDAAVTYLTSPAADRGKVRPSKLGRRSLDILPSEWRPGNILDGPPVARSAALAVGAVRMVLEPEREPEKMAAPLTRQLEEVPQWYLAALRQRPRFFARWNQFRYPNSGAAWFVDAADTPAKAKAVREWFDFNIGNTRSEVEEDRALLKILIFHHSDGSDITRKMLRILCDVESSKELRGLSPSSRLVKMPFTHIFLPKRSSITGSVFADDTSRRVRPAVLDLDIDRVRQETGVANVETFRNLSGAISRASLLASEIAPGLSDRQLELDRERRLFRSPERKKRVQVRLFHRRMLRKRQRESNRGGLPLVPWPDNLGYWSRMWAKDAKEMERYYERDLWYTLRSMVLVTGGWEVTASMCKELMGETVYRGQLY